MCLFTHIFGVLLYSDTDRHVAHMTFTRYGTRKFHFNLSHQVGASLNILLRVHFCVVGRVRAVFPILQPKRHGCVFPGFVFRTSRRRPFWFWPTNRMWKVPWRRRRFHSVSRSTPSRHTHGMSKPAAHWQEKGEENTRLTRLTHLTHSPPPLTLALSSLCLQSTCQSGLDEGPGGCKLELSCSNTNLPHNQTNLSWYRWDIDSVWGQILCNCLSHRGRNWLCSCCTSWKTDYLKSLNTQKYYYVICYLTSRVAFQFFEHVFTRLRCYLANCLSFMGGKRLLTRSAIRSHYTKPQKVILFFI